MTTTVTADINGTLAATPPPILGDAAFLTAIGMATGGLVRRDGKLIPVPTAWKTRYIDFGNGRGPIATITIPWGDVSTAYYTTGIPNIEVYMAFKPWSRRFIKASRYFSWLLGSAPIQSYFRLQIKAMPRGATAEQRARSTSYVWGEVRDDNGQTVTARFKAPDGYTLTVLTALRRAGHPVTLVETAGSRRSADNHAPLRCRSGSLWALAIAGGARAQARVRAVSGIDDEGGADFSHTCDVDGVRWRFRVNLLQQNGCMGLVARRIIIKIPNSEGLYLPPSIETLCHYDQGMVLLAAYL